MAPALHFLSILLLPVFLGISSLAVPVINTAIDPVTHGTQNVPPRSANTCADPSLTRTIFQGFNGINVDHALNFHEAFITVDTRHGSGPAVYTMQGPVFKAWPTQQEFTVPLFVMVNSASTDDIYMVGADAQTPPIVGGFTASNIIAWVYDTAVCGSVPLMSANFAAETDHYYTTDPLEHAGLLADGWTDSGVVAFVLPLPTS